MQVAQQETTGVRHPSQVSKHLCIFGHFGDINTGNEATLQAFLYNLHRICPNVDITCVCTDPIATSRRYKLDALSMNGRTFRASWFSGFSSTSALRRLVVGIPSEINRWFDAFGALRGVGAFIVPGTGLLTDACGLRGWGPYVLFKWCLLAKLRGGKVLFISVGAGPIFSRLGRWFIRCALAVAQFRSYRDDGTKQYLTSIGVDAKDEAVCPDLAFSLPRELISKNRGSNSSRRIVGLGLMSQAGRLTPGEWRDAVHSAYLDCCAKFVKWLMEGGYDVRLFTGDICDAAVIGEFRNVLRRHSVDCEPARLIDAPIGSVEELLSELARADVVVATRFHNVLLSLVLNKPVIAISFHQKCISLMAGMGLARYCEDVRHLDAKKLIELFCEVEENAHDLAASIRRQVRSYRKLLEAQYELIAIEVQSVLSDRIV